jgi:DNA-binding transcriptional ArsR family regulator
MRPLIHPNIQELRPEAILHALSDPNRAAIFAKIMRAGCVEACSAVAALGERVIPKSSLSNHLKILREAGLIRSERHGVEVRNHSRWDDVQARFPGLLPGIVNAYAGNAVGAADPDGD